MRYSLDPVWLVLLYSICRYEPREVAAVGGWPLAEVTAAIKEWQIPVSAPSAKGRILRKQIDLVRSRKGNADARRAVAQILAAVAGSPLGGD